MKLSSHQSFEEQVFNHVEDSGSLIEQSDFLSCRFQRCDLGQAQLKSCTFRECLFEDCGLEMMRVENCVFKNTQFERSKMLGIDWTLASWGRREIAQLIKTINFKDCVLNYSSFMGLNLNGIQFLNCSLLEVDFSEASLLKADFSGSDLQRAIFRATDLREADFRKARNYSISPQLNNITRARFSLPEAMALLYAMDVRLEE
jgi:fluoroquinolone resistance protein